MRALTAEQVRRAERALTRRFGPSIMPIPITYPSGDIARARDLETDSWITFTFKGRRLVVLAEHDGAACKEG